MPMPATADNRDESAAFPGLKGITFGTPGVRAEVGDKTFEGDAAPAGVGLRAAGRYCDWRLVWIRLYEDWYLNVARH